MVEQWLFVLVALCFLIEVNQSLNFSSSFVISGITFLRDELFIGGLVENSKWIGFSTLPYGMGIILQ